MSSNFQKDDLSILWMIQGSIYCMYCTRQLRNFWPQFTAFCNIPQDTSLIGISSSDSVNSGKPLVNLLHNFCGWRNDTSSNPKLWLEQTWVIAVVMEPSLKRLCLPTFKKTINQFCKWFDNFPTCQGLIGFLWNYFT